MKHSYPLAARAAHALRRALTGYAPTLLLALLLPGVAQAQTQALTVTVTPAGPLTLCAGSTQTLTATTTLPGFNVAGSGFDGPVLAVVVQADGKVLVGGGFTAYNGNTDAPDNLLRLNADGSLDTGFNNGPLAGVGGVVQVLAVQADGKVLAGGGFTAYNGNAAAPDRVLRLNADGSLDNTFNPGGTGANNDVLALAVQADGKVLVGGNVTTYNGNAAAPDFVLRLKADGSLDTSFNSGGTGANGTVQTLVQTGGKVLLGGSFTAYNGNTAAPDRVLRLNADGLLDNTFNPGGTGAGTGGGDIVYELAIQTDGKVLVGGSFTAYNANANAPDRVLRLNADGSLDTGFNNGPATGTNGEVYALAVQADGKVLVGGYFTAYNGNTTAPDRVLRLNANGSLDTGFNNGGTGANSDVYALVVQADGRVLVGGQLTAYNSSGAGLGRLLRLNTDGSLNDAATVPAGLAYTWSNGATGPSITVSQPGDYRATATTTANGPGYSNVVRVNAPPAVTAQVTPAGPLALPAGGSATLTATALLPGFNVAGSGFNGLVNTMIVQADGKVLVGGYFTSYNGNAAAPDYVLRLNANGSLDTSFNPGGAGANNNVFVLAVQADGKVLVGGDFTAYNGNANAPDRVLRLNADGSLDNTFNNVAAAGTNDFVTALAVQADGKVLIGGSFTAYNGSASAPGRLLRLNTDGSLDNTFNSGGAGASGYVAALAVQADGKVLAGGSFTAYNGNAAAPDNLLRLNADGSLDNTFNSSGTGVNGSISALAVQADGKVFAGGGFTTYNGSAAAPDNLLRLNTDGSLDMGFNNSGAGANGFVYALAVQADGKVLVGGLFGVYNNAAAAPDNLLRLNADGSLDTGFNYIANAGTNDYVRTVAVQADGRVLAGGNFTAYNGAAAAPDYFLRLNANGSLNDAATPLAGATFVFNPGPTAGPTRTVSTAGTYTATATDPATGCTYASNAVVVTGGGLATTAGSAVPSVQLYPNPARGGGATLTGARPGTRVTVCDALGQLVSSATADAAGTAALALPAGLPAGVYVVRAGPQALRLTVE